MIECKFLNVSLLSNIGLGHQLKAKALQEAVSEKILVYT